MKTRLSLLTTRSRTYKYKCGRCSRGQTKTRSPPNRSRSNSQSLRDYGTVIYPRPTNLRSRCGKRDRFLSPEGQVLHRGVRDVFNLIQPIFGQRPAISIDGAANEDAALSVITCSLLSQPPCLARLRSELKDAIPDPNALPRWSVLEKLPYLICAPPIPAASSLSRTSQLTRPREYLHGSHTRRTTALVRPEHTSGTRLPGSPASVQELDNPAWDSDRHDLTSSTSERIHLSQPGRVPARALAW